MSVEALSVVLHHSRATGTAKLVLLGIANHAGDGGAWPSKATLAHYANVSEANVRKALQRLRALGEVRVHVQAGGMPSDDDFTRPNRYDVLVMCPPWCDRSMNHRDTRKRSGWQAALPGMAPVDKPGVDSDPGSRSIPTRGSESTRGRGSVATPKPSTKPSPHEVPASTTDTRPRCDVCSHPAAECIRRQPVSGHHYTPRKASA